MKNFLTGIIFVVLTFLTYGTVAAPQEIIRTLVNVGYLDNLSPLVFREGTSQPSGLAVDYLNQFSEINNFQFEYVHYKNKNDLCDDLESGKISIAIGFTQITQCKIAINSPVFWQTRLYKLQNSQRQRDIKTVYSLSQQISAESLKKIYPHAQIIEDLPEAEVLKVLLADPYSIYIAGIFNTNRIVQENAANIQYAPLTYNYDTKFIFALTPSIDRKLFNALNSFMTEKSSKYPNDDEMYWLNYAQLGNYQRIQLTPEQKEWVAEKKTIIVAVPKYSYPIGYQDDEGNFSGLSAQLLDIVSASTGLKFKPVFVESLGEMIEYVSLGKADMGAHRSVTSNYTPNTIFSPPFYISRFVAVARASDNDIQSSKNINGKRIVLVKGQKVIQEIAAEFPKSEIITIEGSELDLLSAIVNNKADIAIIPKIVSSYWIKYFYEKKLKEYPLTNPPAVIAFTINRKYTILNDIIKNVMLTLPYNNLEMIDYHWSKSITPPSTIAPRIPTIIYLTLSVLVVIAAISVIIYINSRLRKRRKTNLELYNSNLKEIIDATPSPLYKVSVNGDIILANKAFYDFLSIKDPDSISSLQDIQSLAPNSLSKIMELHETAYTTNREINSGQTYKISDIDFYIRQWISPTQNSDKQQVMLIGGWFDAIHSKKTDITFATAKKNAVDSNYSMLHIAIIDDNSISKILLKAQLLEYGVNVSETNDLLELKQLVEKGSLDAVISDLTMKNITGYDVLKTLVESTQYPPPCYIYTDRIEKEIEEKSLALGATGLIAKPLSIEQLQEILDNIKSSQQTYKLLTLLEKNTYGNQDTLLAIVNVLSDAVNENIQQLQNTHPEDKEARLEIVYSIKRMLSLLQFEDLMNQCDSYAAILQHESENIALISHAFEQSLIPFLSIIQQCQILITKKQSQ
ncbi:MULTISPECIES: transporter substrate-binding domain-containing protein [Yersinia]|uniref:transporter substrate-binding domain-containing protein n=1 Tax=Yersinia TaxID=629 RepID=UPI0011A0F1A8|nr:MULTISPECIES: transporter substrate-binding domain-containing protein [Yersinia]